MTREEAKCIADIYNAFAGGKKIQYRIKGEDTWKEYALADNILTYDTEFRVKPELKYIPFTYEDREQLRDKWIKHRDGGSPNKREHVITGIDIDGITTQTDRFSYAQLLEFMIFTDESPCGKVVE